MQGLNDYMTVKEWDELQQYNITDLVNVYFQKHNRKLSKDEFENRMLRMGSLGVTAQLRWREEYAKRIIGPHIEEEVKAHPHVLYSPQTLKEKLGIEELDLRAIGMLIEKVGINYKNNLVYLVVNDNEKVLTCKPKCAAALRKGRKETKARCFEYYCNTKFCPKNNGAKSL